MITTNILQRTFYIRNQQYLGAGFTFEKNDSQYLASVSHTFPFTEHGQQIEFSIMRGADWVTMSGNILKHPNPDVDIVIIALTSDISPRLPITLAMQELILGREAFFLGFPLGNFMEDTQYLNDGYPIPFVKKGIVSTMPIKKNDLLLFYLDGINNPGFSGGPCVFPRVGAGGPIVCGIIKGYLPQKIEVNTPFGDYGFNANSGLIEVHSINHLHEIPLE
jgi:hypothetical protein